MLKSQSGMSLIEIMVAMLIFGIGISFAMQMLPESNVATSRGRNITKATNLAEQKVEQLMAAGYNNADLNPGAHNDPENPIESAYQRSWVVDDDTPIEGMKRVAVTVSFPTAKTDSTVTVTTLLSSRR